MPIRIKSLYRTGRSLLCLGRGSFVFKEAIPLGHDFVRDNAQRGNGSGKSARAYPMTAIAAAFSRSSSGTILSSVSAAVWW